MVILYQKKAKLSAGYIPVFNKVKYHLDSNKPDACNLLSNGESKARR